MNHRRLKVLCAFLIAAVAAACAFYRVTPAGQSTASVVAVQTPAKAHLKDGGVVVFPYGFRVEGGAIAGSGEKYDLTRQSHAPVQAVPLSDVAALEHYDRKIRRTVSVAVSVPAVIVGTVAVAALMKAIFGSCPTVYSTDGQPALNAELFSHSISRRFEADDVDRLNGVELHDGGYRLKLANEALETHYIDRLALDVVDHPANTIAYPTPDGDPIVFGGNAPFTAVSRSGDDVTAALRTRDDGVYRTRADLTAALAKGLTQDWVELTVPVPPAARGKPPVVALRVRNTLMATVLLYDVVLKGQGIRALDWLDSDTPSPVADWRIYRWFQRNYGLHVQVRDGDSFVTAGEVKPTGPIAWHEVALELPPAAGPELRIRLSFLPDNWMVDWAAVGFEISSPLAVSSVSATHAGDVAPEQAADFLDALRTRDGEYVTTAPGESHTLFFPAPPPRPPATRTLFLRSRGFYIEWLRPEWFNAAGASAPFEPGDEVVVETARRWLQQKDELERRFVQTKIPLAGGAP